MIAKSDVVILAVSVSLLAAGIYRWQSNVSRYYTGHTVASVPDRNQSVNRQGSSASSLVSKRTAAPVNVTTDSTLTTVIDAPVESNFGNTDAPNILQTSTQNTAITAGNDTSPTTDTSNVTRQPLYGTYAVKSGDTLSRIANVYGTTVDTLRTINEISGSLIIVGQGILYPLPAN